MHWYKYVGISDYKHHSQYTYNTHTEEQFPCPKASTTFEMKASIFLVFLGSLVLAALAEDDFRAAALKRVNEYRAKHGANPLVKDQKVLEQVNC